MFNISIEQQVLAKALEYLEPTVGKNTNGLGDNCISMETTGKGSVFMYTNNTLEFTTLEAIIASGGSSKDVAPYVDFRRFKKIVFSIPAQTIINITENGNDLTIQYGANTLNLAGCNCNVLAFPTVVSHTPVTIPKDFVMRALYGAASIITESNSSPIFNCIRFYTDRQTIEASVLDITDKRTFAIVGVATGNNPSQEVLVETAKMKKSLRIFEDYNEIEFAMDSNNIMATGIDPVTHVNMKTGGMISNVKYYCRRLSGTFPTNLLANFTPQPAEYMQLSKEDIMNAFSRIEALQDQTSLNVVTFEVDTDLSITANTTQGWVKETMIPLQTVKKGFKASFRFPHIRDILKTRTFTSDVFEIACLPKHPTNFVIKPANTTDVMYSVSTVATAAGTP